ncbi:hypothetical protein [Fodinicola feengrottensis]|uniref:hypothetical protein n=1 Tax=Fodinicola feengrottensis TaxID=435914 RepID=UPI0036F2F771
MQGGPGTGKTAVALHRAAYLLYTYHRQLSGRGVLIVGPRTTPSCAISRRCCRRRWPRPACCWPLSATSTPGSPRGARSRPPPPLS